MCPYVRFCGFLTFSGCGFPQMSMGVAVLDEKSSLMRANFLKVLLKRVDEITYQNAHGVARKANSHQTTPTASSPWCQPEGC